MPCCSPAIRTSLPPQSSKHCLSDLPFLPLHPTPALSLYPRIYLGYPLPSWRRYHRGITRDPTTYPDADTFLPQRWLSPCFSTYREPLSIYPRLEGHSQFGYGRRICIGVDIVSHELFLVCGALLGLSTSGRKQVRMGNLSRWMRWSIVVCLLQSRIGLRLTWRWGVRGRRRRWYVCGIRLWRSSGRSRRFRRWGLELASFCLTVE